MQRGENGEATRAGAEVERGPHPAGVADDRAEAVADDQLADERARHDHPLVDVEPMSADPRRLHEIGCGRPGRDPPLDEVEHGDAFAPCQPRIEPRLELIDGEIEGRKQQERRLVDRPRGAVAIHQPRRLEPADAIAQPVSHRVEVADRFVGIGGGPPRPWSSRHFAHPHMRRRGRRPWLRCRRPARLAARRACRSRGVCHKAHGHPRSPPPVYRSAIAWLAHGRPCDINGAQ